MIATPEATIETRAKLDPDMMLQSSRRLDWRFLLPEPYLGEVAYLGEQGEMVEPLRLFSSSLTVMAPGPQASGRGTQYDVVVTSRPTEAGLGQAAELVRPGGFLYVEIYGLLHRNRWSWRQPSPTGCAARLKQRGFTGVQLYWHWPNFEACSKIIPLNDVGDLLYPLVGGQRSTIDHLKRMFYGVLLESGWLARLAPCVSLVAERGFG